MINNILEKLKEKYVGQIYDKGYGSWCEVANYVCERLEQKYGVRFTYDGGDNYDIFIRYKGWGVYRIIFRKKKGEQKYNLYRGYYFLWTIKDIEIEKCIGYGNLTKETSVEDTIKIIDEIEEKKLEEQNKKDEKLKEAFNLLKEHFGLEKNYDVELLIQEIDNAYYRLFYKRDEE